MNYTYFTPEDEPKHVVLLEHEGSKYSTTDENKRAVVGTFKKKTGEQVLSKAGGRMVADTREDAKRQLSELFGWGD